MSNRKKSEGVRVALDKARAVRKSRAELNENRLKAIEFYHQHLHLTYSELSGRLNEAGIRSPRGKFWSPTTARALVLSLENSVK